MGQLRALETIGVLPGNVDAISSVSGGTWAASQYFFAKKSSVELLGRPTEPSQLNMKTLSAGLPSMAIGANTSINGELMKYLTEKTMYCAATHPRKTQKCVDQQLKNAYITVIGEAMLGQYKLDKSKYMAASLEQVRQIISRNPRLKPQDFIVPREDRPKTFVMNGALLAPVGFKATMNNTVSFQMSPDYIGSPFHPDNEPTVYFESLLEKTNPEIMVGGGLVESFAFGGEAPEGRNSWSGGPVSVDAPSTPFSLADAVGISSAAFADATTKLHRTASFDPQKPYWPVTPFEVNTWNFAFGDGGDLENFGLLAMLQNEATSVTVFINTNIKLNVSMDLCRVTAREDLTAAATSSLSCLFGFCNQPWLERITDPYGKDQVFSKAEYPQLLCSLQRLLAQGKPLVVQQQLEVQENRWWGIKGGSSVNIIWVYNEQVLHFVRQLPPDTQAQLALGAHGPFKNFPQYLTMLQDPPQLTSYTVEQINLLAALGEYCVLQNRDELCRMFGCRSSQPGS